MDINSDKIESTMEEEKLVAELSELGIRYLSRQKADRPSSVRPPDRLLVDLMRQPSARVRNAVIAVMLAHPEYADAVPAASRRLSPEEQASLRFFYLAAVLLQQEYEERLRPLQGAQWCQLPGLSGVLAELGVADQEAPREKLARLGREHRRRSGKYVNWAGTYEQAARQLLRQWRAAYVARIDDAGRAWGAGRCPHGPAQTAGRARGKPAQEVG
jgi:hypothetical protein